MKLINSTILLACLSLPFTMFSQGGLEEVKGPKNQMTYMTGAWHGEGVSMGRNGKVTVQIKEIVECKLDCNLIVVNGVGTMTDPASGKVTVVHEAFGVITYDVATDKHMIRAYKEDQVTESDIVFLEEKLFQWGFPVPGGNVRFTVDFREPDTWKEKGEFSLDGVNWIPTMDMELKRKHE